MSNGEKESAHMIKDSLVKKLAKVGGKRVSSDFYEALNIKIGRLIIQACLNAEYDNRATIRPSDLD